jgi:membrane protein DedA with SNARE-associated domain
MPYPRFLAFNAAGGLIWAVGFTLLGPRRGVLSAGRGGAGRAGEVILALIFIAVVVFVVRRRRERDI